MVYWDKEKVLLSALNYTNVKEFRKEQLTAYLYASIHKFTKELKYGNKEENRVWR